MLSRVAECFFWRGGFLGAGKTMLIARMIRMRAEMELSRGVITNDQAEIVVANKSGQPVPTARVTGVF